MPKVEAVRSIINALVYQIRARSAALPRPGRRRRLPPGSGQVFPYLIGSRLLLNSGTAETKGAAPPSALEASTGCFNARKDQPKFSIAKKCLANHSLLWLILPILKNGRVVLGGEASVIRNEQAAQPGDGGSLAERLRSKRKELGLTLKQVADAAGLSVGFISQVERGLTAPSLSSLVSISKALGNEISEFLEQPRSEASYTKHERRKPYQIEGQQLAYERISSSFPGQTIHSVIIHMLPGYRSEQISHEGEEMEFILQGSVTSELEGKTVVLHAGDSVHFPSTKPHGLWNHTDKETIVLWVGTMDIFGEHVNE